MRRRFRLRWLPYLVLALVVPLRAFGGATASLGVSASLGGCGLSGTDVSCNVTASFNKLPDAQYYTAQIVRPDSTVQGFGAVASGSGGGRASVTLPVTYTGSGTYTVTIAAYGTPKAAEERDKAKKADLIAKDNSKAVTVPEGLPGATDTTATTTPDTATTTTPVEPPAEPTTPPTDPPPCPTASGDTSSAGPDAASSADPTTSQDPCPTAPPSTDQTRTESTTPPPN